MKLVLTKQLLLTTAILLAGTACTNENNEGLLSNPSSPSDGDATNRREVVVTIKNKLTVTPTGTKAGEIATAEENKISSLDIYVFGAETADGTYTFQERFAYREDPAVTIPAGATSIDLTQEGDGKEASVSMKLKKGLFVKLYAIANQTGLVDPTGTIGTGTQLDGNATLLQDVDFKPLALTNPGQQGTTVLTEGVPTEADFLAFHSPLLDAAIKEDVLNTPLPMSGANTVPTDLTDFEAFARIQASFKLTRTVARFDVVNNAANSRFTISNISMGNARKGTTFFPIAPVGTAPTDLITMPARNFDGTGANTGTTPAAFYSYPSPKEDNGYIILTGKYKMNNTDVGTDVSYQIPFKQEVNGTGSYIEINPNHRYTIAITKADDYHLDFNLTVADWTDEGDVDGFEPTEPETPVSFNLTINGEYDFFDTPERSEGGDSVRVTPAGGTIVFTITDQRAISQIPTIEVTQDKYNDTNNWLEISTPTTKSSPSSKANGITTYEVTATIKESSTDIRQVNIAYVDIKWGQGAGQTKRFSVFRGYYSFITYMDERKYTEIEGHTPQTMRLSITKHGGYIWAPCNCGATSHTREAGQSLGFLYQWGRKTPLKLGNENDVYNGTLPNSATDSYQNEFLNKFIANNQSDYSWLSTSTAGIDKLWNLGTEDNPIKNKENDPCPEGWRVPTKKEMNAFTNLGGVSGLTETEPIYLNYGRDALYSAGKRNEAGVSSSIQYEGYYWTSQYEQSQANAFFYGYDGDMNIAIDKYNLANAFAIRCIKE